jgi:TonB-linked SusC/RagA family outer membrane protein
MLTIFFGLNISAATKAQDVKVDLNLKNVSLKQVLEKIQNQSQLNFIYNNEVVNDHQKVSIDVSNENLELVLDKVLEELDLSYRLVSNNIIIYSHPNQANNAQGIQETVMVKGVVSDFKGEPLPGVNVYDKENPSKGVITGVDGSYSIELSGTNTTLSFSFIGFETQEVSVIGRNVVNITLMEEIRKLDDVVVVGYGTQKKASISGAVSSVSSEEILKTTKTNVVSGLQGLVPGLTITKKNGSPGNEKLDIKMRGTTSINAAPVLIVIDGMPSSQDAFVNLNVNDIESMSFLKDGASASIYGARAASGVIVVTTKKAKKGAFKVNLSSQLTWSSIINRPEFVSSYENAVMINDARISNNQAVKFTDEELEKFRIGAEAEIVEHHRKPRYNYYHNTDWYKEVYADDVFSQTYNVQVAGGTEKLSSITSIGWVDNNGILTEFDDYFRRANIRNNTTYQLNDRLEISTNLSYYKTKNRYLPAKGGGGGQFGGLDLAYFVDNQPGRNPVYSPESGTDAVGGQIRYGDNAGSPSPIQFMRQNGYGLNQKHNFELNANVKYNILPELNIQAAAVTRYSNERKLEQHKSYERWARGNKLWRLTNNPNDLTKQARNDLYTSIYTTLNYEKLFSEKHRVKAIAGYSQEEKEWDWFWTRRINLTSNELPTFSVGQEEDIKNGDTGSEYAIQSYFARVNYSFRDKYFAEFTIRRDGSSRFSKEKRWGSYPSGSVAWRLSEENFLQNVYWLDNLKLRASYGELGNQDGVSGDFGYIALLKPKGDYPFGDNASPSLGSMMIEASMPAYTRTWEVVKTSNIGLDVNVLNNSLIASFDYYIKTTEGILINIPQPNTLGIDPSKSNAGELQTKGWELSINYRNRIGDLKYNIGFILDDNKNEITKFEGKNTPKLGENKIEGDPINTYYGLVTDHIAQSQTEVDNAPDHSAIYGSGRLQIGDMLFKDISGPDGVPDGIITKQHDLKAHGDKNPRYNYSFNLNLEYKGFDLSALFQGVGKKTQYMGGMMGQPLEYEWRKPLTVYRDYWTPENTDAKLPRIRKGNPYYTTYNNAVKHDMSYLRLKNLRLGYTLPKSFISKTGLSNLYLYVEGTNLITWTDFKLVDPEWSQEWGSFYPFQKTYSLGFNLTF